MLRKAFDDIKLVKQAGRVYCNRLRYCHETERVVKYRKVVYVRNRCIIMENPVYNEINGNRGQRQRRT